MSTKSLRIASIISFFVSMCILLTGGYFSKSKVPPIPAAVVSGGQTLTDRAAILRGQNAYQRYGLMDHGSVWGHGALRGMDFSAHTLHMIGEMVPTAELRANRYDPATDTLTLTPAQAAAFTRLRAYWEQLFANGDEHYGFLPGTVVTAEERKDLADFFFWTAWAAGTERPGRNYTYTNNWPPDKSVGNTASTHALIWSIASIIALFAVLGLVVYIVHRYGFFYGEAEGVQAAYRLLATPVTPSQLSCAKFFVIAGLLFVVQIFNGGLLAHYTVHPSKFFLEIIGQQYPFAWAKTWHMQLAIFWIAVSWVGTACYLAPLVAGKEPKG
jgi:nitric oxide reductase subunit B